MAARDALKKKFGVRSFVPRMLIETMQGYTTLPWLRVLGFRFASWEREPAGLSQEGFRDTRNPATGKTPKPYT